VQGGAFEVCKIDFSSIFLLFLQGEFKNMAEKGRFLLFFFYSSSYNAELSLVNAIFGILKLLPTVFAIFSFDLYCR
jgi:hypothetical protein